MHSKAVIAVYTTMYISMDRELSHAPIVQC